MEGTGDEAGIVFRSEYNPVGSYIKKFRFRSTVVWKKNPYLL